MLDTWFGYYSDFFNNFDDSEVEIEVLVKFGSAAAASSAAWLLGVSNLSKLDSIATKLFRYDHDGTLHKKTATMKPIVGVSITLTKPSNAGVQKWRANKAV